MASVFGDSGISRAQVGAMLHPEYRTGSVYSTPVSAALAGAAVSADLLYLFPISVQGSVSIVGLQVAVGTAVVATNVKMALYRASGASAVLVSECALTGDMNSVANTNIQLDFAAAVTLTPALYFGVCKFNGAAQPYTVSVNTIGVGGIGDLFGQPTLAPYTRAAGLANSVARITGAASTYADAFPASAGTLTYGTNTPGSPLMGIVTA